MTQRVDVSENHLGKGVGHGILEVKYDEAGCGPELLVLMFTDSLARSVLLFISTGCQRR